MASHRNQSKCCTMHSIKPQAYWTTADVPVMPVLSVNTHEENKLLINSENLVEELADRIMGS